VWECRLRRWTPVELRIHLQRMVAVDHRSRSGRRVLREPRRPHKAVSGGGRVGPDRRWE
jgi:hypothetical protein